MSRARGLSSLLVFVAPLLAGCAATVIPPDKPVQPVRAYLADYGRHSSLLLPTEDGRALHEYAFGDWDWFAANRTSAYSGLDALLASDGSALGRRRVPIEPDPAKLADVVGAERLLAFDVSRAKATALDGWLGARHRRNARTQIHNPEAKLDFVRDAEPYGLTYNCNHLTAEWLEMLGCEVRGSRMTSKFKVARK